MVAVPIYRHTDGPLATVTIDRPAKRNAMTLAMWQEVGRLFGELATDKSVRGVLLTGTGGSFSAGADIEEFDRVRADAAAAKAYEEEVDACADAIAACPKPTVAVIDGFCLGGGCHLALACDFRFASPRSAIGIPSARLSIVYGVRTTQRLLALAGIANAKRMLYTAARYDAAAAKAMGVIDQVSEEPLAAARAMLNEMAANAPLSIAGAKAILDGFALGPGAMSSEAAQAIVDAAADSKDYAEGRRAYAEKRPPLFKGE